MARSGPCSSRAFSAASTNSARRAARCSRHRSRRASLTRSPMAEHATRSNCYFGLQETEMSRALRVAQGSDREKTAERLLNSSADKFYDPEVDIDWNAPLAEGMRYTPDHRISLYGTDLWDRMTPQQRIELGKHEVASVASNGIWF